MSRVPRIQTTRPDGSVDAGAQQRLNDQLVSAVNQLASLLDLGYLVLEGSVDPTGRGLRAPLGSRYTRVDGSTVEEYIKTGSLDTAWRRTGAQADAVSDGDKGDITVSGGGTNWQIDADAVGTAEIADNSVTNAKLRDASPLSIIGRGLNSTGDPSDIAAGTDGHVLRRSGTTLAFGTVATAGIADDAVSNAKLANMSAATVKGAVTTGDPVDLTMTQLRSILAVSGTFIGHQILTTGTGSTYTPTAGTTEIWVECIGGGGGGGGAQFSSPNGAVGGGGAGGSYAALLYTTAGKTFTYTVGGGGGGGSTAGGAGSSGGSTTFSDGTTTLTACGGGGGNGMTAGSTVLATAGGIRLGTSSNGSLMIDGQAGHHGIRTAATTGFGGAGGSAARCGGGGGEKGSTGTGQAGGQYGGGGGGAAAFSSAGQVGGNGFAGVIVVWEFS